MEVMSRLTPTFAVADVYGPSGTPASNPEWYTTKFASGCRLAAGPMSRGDAYGLEPLNPLCAQIVGTPRRTARSMNRSPTCGRTGSWSSSHHAFPLFSNTSGKCVNVFHAAIGYRATVS